MQPEKKLVAVSHCILNQNAVIHGWERARGAFPFAIELLSRGIALIQLPCPEFLVLGGNRPPMSYEEYSELPDFRQKCQVMLQPMIQQIQAYQAENYHYLGVIGINESPNCSISGQRGVLMEEFFAKCQEAQLSTNYLEVPTWYSEQDQGAFHEQLQLFLERG
ncbi:CD3072 family TudS-related putative desulfidase [Enterococcus dongliensis]|uniref:CD3072 family TudS-related putative desulfidase n=1 Tax=Enterococcus dongliensis TaxID=2559925 RepID=UPI0035D6B521